MITNFHEITENLTLEEKEITVEIMVILNKLTKKKPMYSYEIVELLNKKFFIGKDKKFTDIKLRKYCNYIRSKSFLPIIATSNGYYVSYDKNEIALQIESLEQRSEAILNSVNGLKFYL
jgi:hypothetical protein